MLLAEYSPCSEGHECDCPKPDDELSLDTEGFIHSTESCGTVDGPGVRFVLFLSGCPLHCQYCHNPEAQGKPRGTKRTARDVFAEIIRYKNFIKSGGLTISGGEPLLQANFVHSLFHEAKKNGLHTALDTSGFLGHKASDALLEDTDLVILDIKSWRPMTYKMVTGVCIEPTLKFARRLESLGKKIWVRFVLVPQLTDHEQNIEGVAQFSASLSNVERVSILPFHKMGESKYERLNITYKLKATPQPTAEEIKRAADIFLRNGVVVQ